MSDHKDLCMEEIIDMKKTLTSALKSHISNGLESVDTSEAGQVADIIKDLSETERNCYEACYYKTVIEAMEEGEEPRYGYNNRRYSNGHYAPKGSGSVSMGYRPYIDEEPYINAYMHDPRFDEKMKMGYVQDSRDGGMNRYGKAYNEYKEARRHYTSTSSEHDKTEMNTHANEHISDMIATVRDIWDHADNEFKRRMKSDIMTLVNDMNV